ncbi:hypothetical protein PtA15_15A258 [Puccinia triticina]|uniref:Uncharacterized protein n=1 Tax=Puccinia triticina TaxID=208348 RepID=A0ABY7D2P5_9BASI|nr:uncharacterized protein PtA15_15A258 [Puccinia triticina]WAQ91866.1 hypothetical protein PtA15_15A258 [Puccinia triticina]
MFDYLQLGTGLVDAILAHRLAAAAADLLQLDPAPVYAPCWASPTHDYARTPRPALVPAKGAFVAAILAANVHPYLAFRLLHRFFLRLQDSLVEMPGSKHDLFRARFLPLKDKRLLMRFLASDRVPRPGQSLAAFLADHAISSPALHALLAGLSLAPSVAPQAAPALHRLRTLLAALGLHAPAGLSALPAALLVAEHAGASDWAEAFVRAAALTGRATQVLGRPVLALAPTSDGWAVRLGPHPAHPHDPHELVFAARHLLLAQPLLPLLLPDYVPTLAYTLLRATVILDTPNPVPAPLAHDTLFVLPHDPLPPTHALVRGPDTNACPPGHRVLYLCTLQEGHSEDPETRLRPVLDALLALVCGPGEGAGEGKREGEGEREGEGQREGEAAGEGEGKTAGEGAGEGEGEREGQRAAPITIHEAVFFAQQVHHPPSPGLLPPNATVVPDWPADPEHAGFAAVVEWAARTAADVAESLIAARPPSTPAPPE